LFRPVPAEADFTALEADELARWAKHRVFERSVELRAGAEPWVFYEGPPTANGRPGLHHVWARVYKDLFCRYRTMRGYSVPRKAGWDTHGLPVEVEVEKQLGITAKNQIEDEVGIAEFTRLCRESVRNYVDEWQSLTERIGYWIDSDSAYWTFSPAYVQSVWWNLKSLWDQGLLYEDIKVVPYCPRCGTALSSHELGQPDVYRQVVDESAFVRFPLLDEGDAADRLRTTLERSTLAGLSLVVWTTTPWTLLSNTGAAVGPDLSYAVVGDAIVAADQVTQVFGEGAVPDRLVTGSELVGLHYERPFTDVEPPPASGAGWRVVPGDFVEADEGTGVVHLAPAFGEIDRQVGRDNDLPTLNPVGPDGRFTTAVPWLAGQSVRDTNAVVNDRLEAAGRLVRRLAHPHPYPHCWRCDTPPHLLGEAQLVRPHVVPQGRPGGPEPDHRVAPRAHPGREDGGVAGQQRGLGPFPRPVLGYAAPHLALRRRATCGASGSLAELSELAGRDVSGCRPPPAGHRRGHLPCPECAAGDKTGDRAGPPAVGGSMRRVEPVIDAWFDSGSMPSAQWGYPVAEGSAEQVRVPGRLHLRGHRPDPGLVLLAAGRQHPGARGDPLPQRALPRAHRRRRRPQDVQERRQRHRPVGDPLHPGRRPPSVVDVLAGLAVDADPGQLRGHRLGHAGHLLTLWNTWSFFTTYASLNEFDPADPAIPAPPDRSVLDRWMRSRLYRHRGTGHRGPRRLRAVSGGHGHRRAHRRRLQLVRAPQPPSVLAHRSRCRPGRLPRCPGHAARGAGDRGRPAGPDVPVPGRPDVA
jgi:isoleucyl-tRNA synthetase